MLLFACIMIACFTQCSAVKASEEKEDTRIDINKYENYGTTNDSSSRPLLPARSPFECADTGKIIMSFLPNRYFPSATALGSTNQLMRETFNKIKQDKPSAHPLKCMDTARIVMLYLPIKDLHALSLTNQRGYKHLRNREDVRAFAAKLNGIKNVTGVYEVLAEHQAFYDHRMLKKRLDEIPRFFHKPRKGFMTSLRDSDSKIDGKMKNDSQFRIVRTFDADANVHYFGAIISKDFFVDVDSVFLMVFEFNNDGLRRTFFENQERDEWTKKIGTQVFGDLLLDDEWKEDYVLLQSKNTSCLQKGIRKLSRRYLIAVVVTVPIPWIIGAIANAGNDGSKKVTDPADVCDMADIFIEIAGASISLFTFSVFVCRFCFRATRRSMALLISGLLWFLFNLYLKINCDENAFMAQAEASLKN